DREKSFSALEGGEGFRMRWVAMRRADRAAAGTPHPPSPRSARRGIEPKRALEAERPRLHHVGERADAFEDVVRERLVDLHQADRILARCGAAEMEGGDVDPGFAHGAAEIADEARLVLVAHEQHVLAELGIHGNALDIDDARPVAEERPGDAA